MFKFLLLLMLILSNLPSQSLVKLEDYCMPEKTNTPCKTECKRTSSCGQTKDDYESLTDTQREFVVRKHNEYRQAVANGDHVDRNLPACKGGINTLSYDKECEFLIACHIKSCFEGHDKERITHKGERTGQNLFRKRMEAMTVKNESLLGEAIDAWFAESRGMTSSSVITSYDPNEHRGHVAQLLWGETQFVGCAIMHYRSGKFHKYQIGCNYKSAGCVWGAVTYQDKDCDTFNTEYPALCRPIRPISADIFIPPLKMDRGSILIVWPVGAYLLVTLAPFIYSFIWF